MGDGEIRIEKCIHVRVFFSCVCLHARVCACIGACRAVWVPGQDLAAAHFNRNCGSVLSLHCILYVRLYVHKHAYAGLRARSVSSRPVLVI